MAREVELSVPSVIKAAHLGHMTSMAGNKLHHARGEETNLLSSPPTAAALQLAEHTVNP